MYIADATNNRIRKVTVSTGVITTIAGSSTSASYSGDGGQATLAELYYPTNIVLDSSGMIKGYYYHYLLHYVIHVTIINCYYQKFIFPCPI